MTTKELFEKLKTLLEEEPEVASYRVDIEGCDCFGIASSIEVYPNRKKPRDSYILITRE